MTLIPLTLSGVRHYEKKSEIEAKKKGGEDVAKKREKNEEFESKEYHITKKYNRASDALEIFKSDELIHEPGELRYLGQIFGHKIFWGSPNV